MPARASSTGTVGRSGLKIRVSVVRCALQWLDTQNGQVIDYLEHVGMGTLNRAAATRCGEASAPSMEYLKGHLWAIDYHKIGSSVFGAMRRSVAIAAYLGLAAILGLAAVVHADSGRLEELPAPPPGWTSISPQGINSTGKIVGAYRLQGDVLSRAVNNRGEIVGWSETDFLTTECFTPPGGSEYCVGERHVLGKGLS